MKITCVAPEKMSNHCVVVGVTEVDKKRAAPGLKAIGEDKNEIAKLYLSQDQVSMGLGSTHETPGKEALIIFVGLGDPKHLTQEKLGTAMARGLAAALHVAAEGRLLLEENAAWVRNLRQDDLAEQRMIERGEGGVGPLVLGSLAQPP